MKTTTKKELELRGYILDCNIDEVQFDEQQRPYKQTSSGKLMLSKKSYNYNVKN